MYEHFSDRYPAQSAVISVLARWDVALRATLDDYEEISTWLAAEERSEPREPDELEVARKLVWDLEKEILKHLEKSG